MRYFLAVAEERRFGRAAERPHMTPPLSREIQALEGTLGARLLVRTPKGAELTVARATLLAEVPSLFALAQRAAWRTRLAGQGLFERLAVEQEVKDVLAAIAFRRLRCAHLKDVELACLWCQGDASPILAAFVDGVREFEHGTASQMRLNSGLRAALASAALRNFSV